MNVFLQRLLFPYLDAASDDGSDLSGGDRGDDFEPDEPDESDDDKRVDEKDDEKDEKDDEKDEKDDEKDEKDDEKDDDKQPRGKDGKFAKKGDAEISIPKARFDEQVRREREGREAAERRIAELETQINNTKKGADIEKLKDDLKSLRREERKALVAGDEDKAEELGTRADALNRQIATAEAGNMSEEAKAETIAKIRWDLTIEKVEAMYPQLNPEHESYDQDIVNEILDRQAGIMQRERMTADAALSKAADLVMKRLNEKDDGKGEDRRGLKAGAKDDRAAAARKRNADAAKRSPNNMKDAGIDSDKMGSASKGKIPVGDLTDEEFDALPEATKKQLRGDLV